MLAIYMIGFILGLTFMIGVFIGIIFYVNKRQAKLVRSLGLKDSDINNNERLYANRNIKLKYVCLSCGAKVSGRI
jgi:hypothetical protein